ncbi:MAG: hypothetical protein H7210_11560 [Pyrinomonadaceae bacterium]|nr:hypothetical protein [Phycisphaerales bacterium]
MDCAAWQAFFSECWELADSPCVSSLDSFAGPDPVQGVHHTSRLTHVDPDKKREQQEQKKEKRRGDEVDLTSTDEPVDDQPVEPDAVIPDTENENGNDDEDPPVVHIDVQA